MLLKYLLLHVTDCCRMSALGTLYFIVSEFFRVYELYKFTITTIKSLSL